MQFRSIRFHTLNPYFKLMRLHQPTGILLLLWPCWWSIGLATPAGQFPSLFLLTIFGLGAILMRGAGCIINDMWDRKIDAEVERTKNRPIASGEISIKHAIIFISILLLLSLLLLLQLNHNTQILGLCSLLPVAIYPLMKRFFPCPQLFLGLTFSWGALMGWVAVTDNFDWTMIWLYIAAICWTIGYDTIYALQDKADDERIGVNSSARLFGKHARLAIGICYAFTVFFLALCGDSLSYFFALAAFSGLLFWQVLTLNLAQPMGVMAKFKLNGWAGAVLFAGILF